MSAGQAGGGGRPHRVARLLHAVDARHGGPRSVRSPRLARFADVDAAVRHRHREHLQSPPRADAPGGEHTRRADRRSFRPRPRRQPRRRWWRASAKLDYSKPLSQMRDYLAAMDTSMYMAVPPADKPLRLLAALGPKMLELSATADRRRPPVLRDARTHRGSPCGDRSGQAAVRRAEGHRVDRRRRSPRCGQPPDRSVCGLAQLPQQLETDRIHGGRDRAASEPIRRPRDRVG